MTAALRFLQIGIVRIRVKIFAIEHGPLSLVKSALAFVAPHSAAPALVAVPSRPAVAVPLQLQEPRPSFAEMSRPTSRQRLVMMGIAALHLLGLWGLGQVQDVRRTMARMAPVVVRLVAPAEPPKPLPPPVAMPQLKVPTLTMVDPPLIAVATAPAPSPVFAAIPTPPPAPTPVQASPTPVIPITAPVPQIKQIPASAVRYLKEPRMTVPLMSKRLRESGVVQLRVIVDVRGQPREITLAKSSGFARLDEQALQDMRSARFAPYTENGQPVEWEVIAPMSYEVDR
jgi:protein TonB